MATVVQVPASGGGGAPFATAGAPRGARPAVVYSDGLRIRLQIREGKNPANKADLYARVTQHLGVAALPQNSRDRSKVLAVGSTSLHSLAAAAEAYFFAHPVPEAGGTSAPSGGGDTGGGVGDGPGAAGLTIRVRSDAASSATGGGAGSARASEGSAASGSGAGLVESDEGLSLLHYSLRRRGNLKLEGVCAQEIQWKERRTNSPPAPGDFGPVRAEVKHLLMNMFGEEAQWVESSVVAPLVEWLCPQGTSREAFEEEIARTMLAVARGRHAGMATQVAQSMLLRARRTLTPNDYAAQIEAAVAEAFKGGITPRSAEALKAFIEDSAIPAAKAARAQNAKVASGAAKVFSECAIKPKGNMWSMLVQQVKGSGGAKRKMGTEGDVEAGVVPAAARAPVMTTYSKFVADQMHSGSSSVVDIARYLCRTPQQIRDYFKGKKPVEQA